MIKNIFLALLLANSCASFSAEKPVLKTGFYSTGYLKSEKSCYDIYPEESYEKIYLSVDENICDYFKFYSKTDFYYYDFNKYYDDVYKLRSYLFSDQLYLYFNPSKINEILLRTKPSVEFNGNSFLINLENAIQYKIKIDNFCFRMKYSNQYSSKAGALFYHNVFFCFYWNHPKYDFIKYRTSLSVYFQHYTSGNAKISFVKSAVFSFEIAVDFNKIDYEDLFDKKDYDGFFDE